MWSAQRLTTLLDGILALQAVARRWSSRPNYGNPPCQSAATGQKKPKWTRLLIIDSQAVKNTCNASVESKGFCHYKYTNGIKRHLAVDTLGLPFFTHCTLIQCQRWPRLDWTVESQQKITFAPNPWTSQRLPFCSTTGITLTFITAELQKLYLQIMTKIRFELAPKPTKAEKAAQGKTGFVVVATRWGKRALECWDGTL